MMPSFRSLSILAAIAFSFSAFAQESPFNCGGSDLSHIATLHHNDPQRLLEIAQNEQALEQFTQQFAQDDGDRGTQYVIPIVFHIIHNNGVENISDDQVKDAVRIINNDYNKLNTDWDNVRPEFLSRVADIGITFRLAGLDPNGNCTSGITRTVSELTNDGTQTMKDLIDWPRNKYLNVWVAASANGAAGYSMYPGSVSSPWAAGADGIVVEHNYVGSIGTSSLSHSRTLTHEIGHFLNLKHCWGDSNTPGLTSNCDIDDGVTDTPNTEGWTICNLNGATCGSTLDNVENYMEYSYCTKMFTTGQKTRVLAALNSSTASRSNLKSSANLIATGTADPQALCAAAFSSDRRIVCVGDSVHFTDQSYHDPNAWSWSFTGGSPATSTLSTTAVAYSVPGVYEVQLTAGNGLNNVTINTPSYITVLPSTGIPVPFVDDLESTTSLPSTNWIPNNPDGDGTFELRTNVGYSGSHSIRMNNNGNASGRVDELYSTTIDLSSDTTTILGFRYAFARKIGNNDDILRVYASSDCGAHWSMRKQIRGSTTLSTAPDQSSPFTPNSGQWVYTEITNILTSFHVSDFRFKFWFQGNGGNDLWLDDININGVGVGVTEQNDPTGLNLQVVPNPASDAADLAVNLPHGGTTRVELLDPLGRTVRVISEMGASAGYHRWALPVEDLRSGLYLVRVQQGEASRVVRFTKE